MSATLEFAAIREHAKLLQLPTLSGQFKRFAEQAAKEAQTQLDFAANSGNWIPPSKDAGGV